MAEGKCGCFRVESTWRDDDDVDEDVACDKGPGHAIKIPS